MVTSTNRTDLAYVAEVTPGTTPPTPAFQSLPVTGIGLQTEIATAVSEAIRNDRQIDDLVPVDENIQGSTPFELTFEAWTPLMIALLQGAAGVSVDVSGSDVDVTQGTSTYLSSGAVNFSTLTPGMFVNISGFQNAANNGPKEVVSSTATDLIVTDPDLVSQVAGDAVVFKAESYRNGAEEAQAFTFRKGISPSGGVESIFYFVGCEVSQMAFAFNTAEILNATMDIMGLSSDATTTPIAGETITPVANYALMNSVNSVVAIDVGGLPAQTEFQTLNLTINNNITGAKAIGTLGSFDLASFTLDATGDVELYFEDLSAYNLFKQAGNFSLAIAMQDTSGNTIVMSMPNCKFETMEEPIPGKDEFLFQTATFRALRDPVLDYMVQFDLIPA
jgi:hypothetical protein